VAEVLQVHFMSNEVKEIVRDTEQAMQKSIEAMEHDFQSMRTGRASPALVERIQVEYYGSDVPLLQLASISIPEPQVILIKPFDPSTLKAIEKGISNSDIKLTPNNDGKVIRLTIPPMTQERRREMVKLVHKRLEEAKVSMRNSRRDGMDMLKEYENEDMISEDEHKRGKEELEALTKRMTDKADEASARKEREVMEL
jgi:ribosome recycling factor